MWKSIDISLESRLKNTLTGKTPSNRIYQMPFPSVEYQLINVTFLIFRSTLSHYFIAV